MNVCRLTSNLGWWIMESIKRLIVSVCVVLLAVSVVSGADWPQFRGPTRDGICKEAGLVKKWPEGGPKELWAYEELGGGYSSLSIVDGTIYTVGLVDSDGILYALDLNGKVKWKKTYGPEWTSKGNYPGTRTTPTIDGDRLYLMSGHGRIACYNAKTGDRLWFKDTLDVFDGKNIRWGIAESVLIDGEKAICTPGGKDATVVALNKMNGETIWTSKGLSELSGYCSPMIIDRGPNRIILTLVQQSFVGIDANTGQVYWKHPNKVSYDINAVSPAYANGMGYITNGYRQGGHMYVLSADGTTSEKKWSVKNPDVHHGGVVLVDGCVHGAGTDNKWYCVDLATGNVKFSDRLVGKGSVIYGDGMLYGYGEKGEVGLIKLNADGYDLVSSFEITKGNDKHWAHPVISDGRLYIRHGNALMCYDIKAR